MMAGIMRHKLLTISLVCIAISLSGCTGISVQIPQLWGSPSITPLPSSDPLNAEVVSESIPNNMFPGQVCTVSITMKNIGYSQWSGADQISLSSTDESSNDAPLFNNSTFFINSNDIVKDNSNYTWNFKIIAPKYNGNYTIRYQMKDKNNTYFGAILTKNVTVGDINSTAIFVPVETYYYPSLKTMYIKKGIEQNVSITVKNMGRDSWSDLNSVHLAVVDYESNNATLFNPTLLFYIGPDIVVNPGDQCTWKFQLHAPPSPGTYKLEYQMKQGDEWLGKPLIVYITVT